MQQDRKKERKKGQQICAIEPTNDQLTGRADLCVFAIYLRNIAIFPIIERLFGTIRKNDKGLPIIELFVQIFCFFMDGSSRHLTWFDHLAGDQAYAKLLGTGRLASSHAIKRFFKAFSFCRVFLYRKLLQELFLWRLKQSNPALIVLGLDTTVFDNDDAKKRHGVQPTYKKVKGFQPLQLTWSRYLADAVFRAGSKHSNHGDTVEKMLEHVVAKIRADYRQEVPIIVRMDAGFYDEALFNHCEKLKIGYTCGGKLYSNVIDEATDAAEWHEFRKADEQKKVWMYTDMMCKQKRWAKARRAIFSTLQEEKGQYMFEGLCRESVIITNLGMGEPIDEQLTAIDAAHWLKARTILGMYHERGIDELANRALKTFGHEQLPFKRFDANAAWYFMLVLGNNLFEAFKEDATEAIIPVSVYADTFRRKFIDTAGKIVFHSGKLVMKVPKVDFVRLRFDQLFVRLQVGLPQLC